MLVLLCSCQKCLCSCGKDRNLLLWSCDIAGVFVVKIETAAVVVMSETGAVTWGYVRNC